MSFAMLRRRNGVGQRIGSLCRLNKQPQTHPVVTVLVQNVENRLWLTVLLEDCSRVSCLLHVADVGADNVLRARLPAYQSKECRQQRASQVCS